jgi:peptidoglycan/LPS O-acetylase OafA/YrhL
VVELAIKPTAEPTGGPPLTLTAETLASGPGQHIPSLDGLRAVSVMLVLGAHFVNEKLIPGGLGVDIFFVISGFLISRLLLAEGKTMGRISLPRFYARRAIRLLPVVVVFTGIVVALYWLMRRPINWLEPAAAIFYFANYLYAPIAGGAIVGPPVPVNPHLTMPFVPLWSLSVEEHFYLLMPATLIFLKRDPRRLIAAMIAVCLVCLCYRITMATFFPDLMATNFFHFRTECRIDLLAFGVALASLCELEAGQHWLERYARAPLLWIGVLGVLLCLVIRGEVFRQTLRYTLEGVSISCIIASLLIRGGWIAAILNHPAFGFVGRLSYSLYVWSLMGSWIGESLHASGIVRSAAEFAVTFACALASYLLLEKPLVNLRRRLAVRARKPAMASA